MRRSAALPFLLAALAVAGCSTAAPGAPTPAVAATGAPAAAPAAPASFCDAARADIELEKSLSTALSGGSGDGVKDAVAQIRSSNAAVEAAAPAEIRPDIETAYSLSDKELDLIAAGGTGAAAAAAQDPGFSKIAEKAGPALARMGDYLKDKCGIDPASSVGLTG